MSLWMKACEKMLQYVACKSLIAIHVHSLLATYVNLMQCLMAILDDLLHAYIILAIYMHTVAYISHSCKYKINT